MTGSVSQSTMTSDTIPEWKQRAAAKSAEQLARIPPEWKISSIAPKPRSVLHYLQTANTLTPEELQITEIHDARVLLESIAAGRYSVVQVVRAYCKRAAIAQQLVQCCTELLFEEALQRAEVLDQYFNQTGQVFGPFHGLPVSLKDIFDVKGHDSTVGWVGIIGRPAKANSLITDVLISQGAVPFVKTNVAQALMEEALAERAHSLGVTAALWVLVLILGALFESQPVCRGFMGSVARLGVFPSMKHAPPVVGPLVRDLSTIEMFMGGVLSARPWDFDPSLVPLPWRKELAYKPRRPLKIGYYLDDGVVRVQPPIAQALSKVIHALKRAGHEVIEWDTTTHRDAFNMWTKATFADGGKGPRQLSQLGGEPLIAGVLIGTEDDQLSVTEYEKTAESRLNYQEFYLKRWRESGIDALITPVQPYVGLKPKTWATSQQYIGYTSHWNWLEYAALTVPASVVQHESENKPSSTFYERSQWDAHAPRNPSDQFNWKHFDHSLVQGMPVGVQIVGGKFGEEMCIAVAKVVKDIISAP